MSVKYNSKGLDSNISGRTTQQIKNDFLQPGQTHVVVTEESLPRWMQQYWFTVAGACIQKQINYVIRDRSNGCSEEN